MRRTANLGLKANLNLLVAYDLLWPAAFEAEKVRLAKALGPVAKGIEHYGSTAVPGLCAKPILDIMAGISPLSEWERCKPALEALGYDYAEGAGVPGHYIFGRGRDRTERTHLVHVVGYQEESWRGSLAFRDALRRDARVAHFELPTAEFVTFVRSVDRQPRGGLVHWNPGTVPKTVTSLFSSYSAANARDALTSTSSS